MKEISKDKADLKISKNRKKFFILITILIMFILFFIFIISNIFQNMSKKISLENSVLSFAKNNENIIFSIDKCTFFSSADTKNKNASVTNFTIENLYQYTDMAFFINNHSTEHNMENTLKAINITNINFTTLPSIGEPALYYKNINDFAKSDIVDSNKVENQLNFEVSSEDTLSFDTPSIYNNCASPIVLSYVNSNIKTDYTITDTSNPITYNGSLLKRFNVSLESIKSSLSFDINITNNLDQDFKTTVYIDIPLGSDDLQSSIYDGKYTIKKETNYIFYRY